MFQIIVHGGANDLLQETEARNKVCQSVVEQVKERLLQGSSALEACELGVSLLEDSPMLNAGFGSYFQLDNQIRMDACIMDSHLRLGAVVQVSHVRNPIKIARCLLEKEMHSVLSGTGAERFALEQGFSSENVITEKQSKIHQENINRLGGNISYDFVKDNYETCSRDKLGTVGCVVRDENGLIVAGTSTGGLKVCYPGRVGDVALVGCGTYANEFVGVSCTGVGEKIMRVTLARLIAFYVENGETLADACKKGVKKLGEIGGKGGVIAISQKGEIFSEYNTETMSFFSFSSENQ